jgi:hypothetical protein
VELQTLAAAAVVQIQAQLRQADLESSSFDT